MQTAGAKKQRIKCSLQNNEKAARSGRHRKKEWPQASELQRIERRIEVYGIASSFLCNGE